MIICSLIVTYADRFNLLEKVISQLIQLNISKLVIVDNNSNRNSWERLKSYQEKLANKVILIRNESNLGSAGGYSVGLEYINSKISCDYIWLLDDDNLPEPDALDKLLLANEYLGSDKKNILSSSRHSSRSQDYNSIYFGISKKYRKNSICGWHFVDMFRQINIKNKPIEKQFFLMKNEVAPYGGLFFHKSVIDIVGLPLTKLFLYGDDHEWTNRMASMGFSLILCSESKINDIDIVTINNVSPEKTFYQIRNHTWLSKKYVTNNLVFIINVVVFVFLTFSKTLLLDIFYLISRQNKKNKNPMIIINAVLQGLKLKID